MPTTVTGTTTTVSGLTPGTLYRFRVRARNSVGYGPYSAWSEAGTPTGGPTPPPPPATLTLSVNVSPRFVGGKNLNSCGKAAIYVGEATAMAQLSGGANGLLGNVTYTWQGRYLRIATPAYGPGAAFVMAADPNPTWIAVAPTYIASNYNCDSTKAYYFGSTPTSGSAPLWLRAWINNGIFPQHFWELRCVATAQVILPNSQVVSATGTSRTIAFKEMWNGVDYPTNIGGGEL